MQISCPNCNSTFRVPDGTIKANGRIVRCSKCSNEWLAKAEPITPPVSIDASDQKSENFKAIDIVSEFTNSLLPTQTIAENANSNLEPVQPLQDLTISENIATVTSTNSDTELKQSINQANESLGLPEQIAADEPPIPAATSPKVYIRYEAPKIPLYDYSIFRYLAYLVVLASILGLATYKLVQHHSIIIDHFPQLEQFYEKAGIFRDRFLMIENIESHKQEIKSSNNEGNLFEVSVDVSVRNIGKIPQTLSQLRFTVYNSERKIIDTQILEVKKIVENNKSYAASGRLNRLPPDCTFVTVDLGNFTDFLIRDIKYININ